MAEPEVGAPITIGFALMSFPSLEAAIEQVVARPAHVMAGSDVETARKLGVSGVKIATVVGDDVLNRLPTLHAEAGQAFVHIDTGAAWVALGRRSGLG